MPSPQPTTAIKRPPIFKNVSSSSSLDGMEQAIPSFQSFIKRTPPLDHQKPLPPTPLIPRRASSSSPPRSRGSSLYAARRSSSVYSRTASQWVPDDVSWRSADFADEPLPPMPFLQRLAYTSSQPTLPLREPRTYSPLIRTPSPTASRNSTPSPPPTHQTSILLPTPPVSIQVPKKHLRTVSIEKAQATVMAPGAVHLLPEELRAQTIGKSRSQEPLRVTSFATIAGMTPPSIPPQLPEPPTLVDNQGRTRTIVSPVENVSTKSEYPFPKVQTPGKYSAGSFKVGKGPEKLMLPLANQQRQASRDKAAQAFGIDKSRGRTRQRGPRNMDYSHYLPRTDRMLDSSSSEEDRTDAQKMAKDYHTLLTEQYRQPSGSPGNHGTDSDNSIKNHMKMVPQPLFKYKPPAKLPSSASGREVEASVPPHHQQNDSGAYENVRRRSSSFNRSPFALRLASTSGSTQYRRSTSGSIPISPPDSGTPVSVFQSPEPSVEKRKKAPRPRRNSHNNRASAFYPHVASRKGGKGKTKTRSSASRSQTPPMPLLFADIIAQRLKTPEDTPITSSSRGTPSMSLGSSASLRRGTTVSSDKVPLYQRLAKGATRYADILTKPPELPGWGYEPITTATVAPGSSHLLPSPARSKEVLLGWSDVAKSTFDKGRSSIQSPVRSSVEPETSRFTHIVSPARPLDDSRNALREVESPTRKSSMFGGMFDGWKESKAEKRREELKKIIKVVPPTAGNSGPNIKRRSSTFGWM